MAALLRAERPDVVWCLGADLLARVGLLLCRLSRVPVLVSFHGARKPGERLITWTTRPVIHYATHVLAVCDAIRRELIAEGLAGEKVVVQLNGVDTSSYRPSQDPHSIRLKRLGVGAATPVIGHVGSLLPIKAQHVLIEAFATVRAAFPKARLVMIGRGPLRAELEALARRLGVDDGLVMLGERVDVPELLPCFDLLMMSSQVEGCPNVVIEAMACGVPVVATRAGGTPEVILDGETGFLAEVGDAKALARYASAILGDPGGARQLGERARKRVEERFDVRRMIADRMSLLDAVADR